MNSKSDKFICRETQMVETQMSKAIRKAFDKKGIKLRPRRICLGFTKAPFGIPIN